MKLLTDLIRTVERAGGSFSKSIEIVDKGSGNFGLFAKKPIKQFEVLIEIPNELCLRTTIQSDQPNQSNPSNPLLKSLPDTLGLAKRSLRNLLMTEKSLQDSSAFSLYLQSLPTTTNFYYKHRDNKQMFEQLKSTTFYQIHKHYKLNEKYLEEDLISARTAQNDLDQEKNWNSEELKWFDYIINTRSIQLSNQLVLLPLIDLCNHSDQMNYSSSATSTQGSVILQSNYSLQYSNRIDGYTLVTLIDVDNGQEIVRSYGELSFEDKIVEYDWIDTHQKPSTYSLTKLSLPFQPKYFSYGKLKYVDSLSVYSGQQQFLFLSICEQMKAKKVTRNSLVRALKRRLRQLQVSQNENSQKILRATTATTASATEKSLEKVSEISVEDLKNVESILNFESNKVELLLTVFGNDARYDHFMRKMSQLKKDREFRESGQVEFIQHVATALFEETGLDLTQLYQGDEGQPGEEDGEEEEDQDEEDEDGEGRDQEQQGEKQRQEEVAAGDENDKKKTE